VTPTRRRVGALIGLGASVVALSLFIVSAQPFGPVRHGPGGGPLTTLGDPWALGLDPKHTDRWTFGVYLCRADPSATPVIDEVVPVGTVGAFAFLGSSVRRFTPTSSHPPILSADGYPPTLPDAIVPTSGYRVSDGCSRDEEFANYNELLLGIAKQGDSGGGWAGEEVRYHVGDRQYVLALEYVMVVCGPAVQQYC
jgi:hypothetical protein